ncbi:putative Transcriptional regulator, TetR family [Nitrosopumilus piranensis]|uniref:Putative Transcriptional regulator, TetR family n=1 Tax=Nitrosopumilus piranensis TaxID=1582439 RepID=A0A0C5BUX0_9ARCH|nr:putative Transcriptional regulator, TetR family [Nitrosopumilus piranensis]
MCEENNKVSSKPLTKIQKKILQIAKKKFSKNGYQKTSMNDIVSTAGVSKGVLFYHFHSKEELFFQVLSQGIDAEFQRIFRLLENEGKKLFKKKENLFDDLKKYYDLAIAGTKDFERLWLEGRIESENNVKLRQMMEKKDKEITQILFEGLKISREKIGILQKYDDKELMEIVKGIIVVMRGLFIEKLSGKDQQESKNTWARIMFIIYTSKK